ncbi:hypothetical protein [Novilysobacter arseniciresistens]|uniref:hypothetical protein n=1 Tax=Novilysobacter arseniciresistens TaxID=1385522 RepID=UPI001269F38A|nr:hypothetical protein [Lysobacter arseniciresistens]
MAQEHWTWLFGKLSSAVGVLVAGESDARNRVFVASKYLLQIPPDAVPPECQEDLRWIRHMLTRHEPGPYDDSAVAATFRRTRNTTASKIASRVWHVYAVYGSVLEERKVQRALAQHGKKPKLGVVVVPPKASHT